MRNPVFSCPKCGQVLGDIPTIGRLVAICVNCRLKYEVVRGRASTADSRQVIVRAPRYLTGYGGENALRYELRLELPSGQTQIVSFELPERDTQIVARPGDVLSAIYLMRGAEREQMLSIHNATTGEARIISFPGDKTAATASWIALGTAAIAFVVVAAAGASAPIGVTATLGTFIGMRVALGRLLMPRAEVSSEEKTRLAAARRMLTEKLTLETARTRTVRELEARRDLRDRLVALRTKMLNVGLDLYQGRIAVIDRALALIDTQLDLEIRLRDGYERSIQMIEIELETGAAAVALDDGAAPYLMATLAEMRDLEDQQADLTRQLAANVEVEALLKGTST